MRRSEMNMPLNKFVFARTKTQISGSLDRVDSV